MNKIKFNNAKMTKIIIKNAKMDGLDMKEKKDIPTRDTNNARHVICACFCEVFTLLHLFQRDSSQNSGLQLEFLESSFCFLAVIVPMQNCSG